MFTFAVSEGVIPYNPLRGIKKPAVGKRTRRLTPAEYRALGKALEDADGETWQGVVGTKLFLLTGFRLSEIAGLMWSEIDENGSCIRLDDSTTGASTCPIGKQVFDVLATVPRETESKYVLPGLSSEGGHYMSLDDAVERPTERAGFKGVTSHTLRHSFASSAGDLGFTEITIAALIRHSAGNVPQRYLHHLDSVLIAAADKVSGHVWRK